MTYSLFIDDERDPHNVTWVEPRYLYEMHDWVITRTVAETLDYIDTFGMPSTISFDHDLAGEERAITIVQAIIDKHIAGTLLFPDDFQYKVHSKNPVGAENIRSLLQRYIDFVKAL